MPLSGATGPTDRPQGIHVVVVAYFGAVRLGRCLASLGGRFPVFVVDNSSDLEVRDVVLRHGAVYIDPGRNLGFGAGVNLALRAMGAPMPRQVLLLNPDAVISAVDVDRLGARLEQEGGRRVGMLSPSLRGPEGSPQRVLWPFPTPARAWLDAVGLGRLNRAPGFAVGAVLLLRGEAIAEVGPFDERFFLYAEETDWQRRARTLGWRAEVAGDIVAEHEGGGTSPDPLRREALFYAGGETYLRKWFGRRGWAVYRAAVLIGSLARCAVLTGERRRSAARRVRIFWVGPRRAAELELS